MDGKKNLRFAAYSSDTGSMKKVFIFSLLIAFTGITPTVYGQYANFGVSGGVSLDALLYAGIGGSASGDLGMQSHLLSMQAQAVCPAVPLRCWNQYVPSPNGNLFLQLGMGLGGLVGDADNWRYISPRESSGSSRGSWYSRYNLSGSRSGRGGSSRSRSWSLSGSGSRGGSDSLTSSISITGSRSGRDNDSNGSSIRQTGSRSGSQIRNTNTNINININRNGNREGTGSGGDPSIVQTGQRDGNSNSNSNSNGDGNSTITRTGDREGTSTGGDPRIVQNGSRDGDGDGDGDGDNDPNQGGDQTNVRRDQNREGRGNNDFIIGRNPPRLGSDIINGGEDGDDSDEEVEAAPVDSGFCPDGVCTPDPNPGIGSDTGRDIVDAVTPESNTCEPNTYNMFPGETLESELKVSDEVSKCIERAMFLNMKKAGGPKSQTFNKCESATGKPDANDSKYKPCINDFYVNKVVKSYKQAYQCIKAVNPSVNLKDMLPMFNHESRFHVNQINIETSMNSVGITQLVAEINPETQKFDNLLLGDVQGRIQRLKTQAACNGFSSHFSQSVFKAIGQSKCQLIHPSVNPERAMIYGQFAYVIAKEYVTNNFRSNNSKACPHEMSSADRAMVRKHADKLGMIGYHRGAGKLNSAICTYARQKGSPLTDADFRFESGKSLGPFFTKMTDAAGVDYADEIHTELWGLENNRQVYKNNRNVTRSAAEEISTRFQTDKGALSCSAF